MPFSNEVYVRIEPPKIYDLVGETQIEDKWYAGVAMKDSANTQGQCHMSVQSNIEAQGRI